MINNYKKLKPHDLHQKNIEIRYSLDIVMNEYA